MKILDSEQSETIVKHTEVKLLEQQGVYDNLNQYLTEQEKEQKTILEARDILGSSAENLTDEQIINLVNEVQYLVDTWLEEFERKVYCGTTLNELLHLNSHEYTISSK